MKHLGDITKIHNAPFVDCITFGSPCQDLSVAGKRAGLAGERSGLFMEAVRIIKEMRVQSGGVYPTFAVWENVPGAFSSNKGEDFRAVLEELARIKEPEVSITRPEKEKWAKSGFICGNGWSVAWRTLDAQYWGVPQRRRRIALVMDLAGQRAGEILFEHIGVSRYLEPSITPWKGIAKNPAHSAVGNDRVVERAGERLTALPINDKATRWKGGGKTRNHDGSGNGLGVGEEDDPMFTLTAGDRHAVLCRAQANTNAETYNDMSPTLTACHDGPPIVFESHSQDARYTQQGDTSPACTAQWGTGGNNMPLVVEKHGFACCGYGKYNECIGTLRASGGDSGGGSENIIAECIDCRNHKSNGDLSGTLQSKENGGFSLNYINPVAVKILRWIVRRLTPTECERLQGYPDGWTDIGEWVDSKGKKHKSADSPRYKALGNSIALPQWWWITCKMAAYLPEHATLGSLFDGIGGFPLVWETRHGKGTAVWASEIEEFPIAVTKKWFPEVET